MSLLEGLDLLLQLVEKGRKLYKDCKARDGEMKSFSRCADRLAAGMHTLGNNPRSSGDARDACGRGALCLAAVVVAPHRIRYKSRMSASSPAIASQPTYRKCIGRKHYLQRILTFAGKCRLMEATKTVVNGVERVPEGAVPVVDALHALLELASTKVEKYTDRSLVAVPFYMRNEQVRASLPTGSGLPEVPACTRRRQCAATKHARIP